MHWFAKKATAEFEQRVEQEKIARMKAEEDFKRREMEVAEYIKGKEHEMKVEAERLKKEIEVERIQNQKAQNEKLRSDFSVVFSRADISKPSWCWRSEVEVLQAQIRKETDERKRAERRLAELEVARKEDKSIQMEDESMQIEDEVECDMENELENEQLQSKAKSSAKAKKTSATAKVGTLFSFRIT